MGINNEVFSNSNGSRQKLGPQRKLKDTNCTSDSWLLEFQVHGS